MRSQDALAEKDRELAESKRREEEAKRLANDLQRKLARKLMADKTPIPEIAGLTGLSAEEIEKLT